MTMQEKIRPGYKQTEAGVIPEDWVCGPLNSLGEILTGGTPPTGNRALWGSGYPWVTPSDIKGCRDIFETERSITAAGIGHLRALPENTVLVTCIASIGKNAILRRAGSCNQQINAIVPHSSYSAEFIYYLMEHSVDRLKANAGITATAIISKKTFGTLLFAVPNFIEQSAIAAALSDADARIAALEALIAKKRDLKQAAMQQLLTGKTRLPGFSGDWEVKRLGEFAQFLSGTYLAKPAYRPGTFVVQGAGAAMGEHDTANFPFAITVIGRVGTVGRPRFMPGGCWVNNNAAAIRALPSDADPRFVHLLLTQYDWSLATSVTAQPFLGIGTLMGSTHRLPPKAEQTAIAEVIFDMDAELSSLEAEADKARAIKQGMMQNLLTGKVRLV